MRLPMPKISIGALMVVVLAIAVAIAALRFATPGWASLVLSGSLLMLGVALLGVIFLRGPRRAFWAGFLVFAGGYLLVCYGPWFGDEVRPLLLTNRTLNAVFPLVVEPKIDQTVARRVWLDLTGSLPPSDVLALQDLDIIISQRLQGQDDVWNDVSDQLAMTGRPTSHQMLSMYYRSLMKPRPADVESFHQIGHGLFALLLGSIGGLIARRMDSRRRAETAAASNPLEPSHA